MKIKLILKIMRVLVLLVTIGLTHVSAETRAQITFKGHKVPIENALNAIRNQSGFAISADRSLLENAKPISIDVKDMPLDHFLDKILNGQSIDVEFMEKTILLSHKPSPAIPTKVVYAADTLFDVTFIVVDSISGPMAGANVIGERRGQRGITDGSGRVILKSNVGDTFEVSYIGFESGKVILKEKTNARLVYLRRSTNDLDEVQVIAFGETTRRLSTGNVTTIRGEEIQKQPIMNPILALQGRVPGLRIDKLSNHSSAPLDVVIRGRQSIDPNRIRGPLYVIDGVAQNSLALSNLFSLGDGISTGNIQAGLSVTGGQDPLFLLNSNEVESVSILKDGDATALYGSRGANGVILINTKRAKFGRPSVDVRLEGGIITPIRKSRFLNLSEYLEMRREAFKNDGLIPGLYAAPDLVLWDTTRYTDWYKDLMGVGHHRNYGVSFSGGNLNSGYRLGASHVDKVDVNSQGGKDIVTNISASSQNRALNGKLGVDFSLSYNTSLVDAIRGSENELQLAPNAPSILDERGLPNFAEWIYRDHAQYPFVNRFQPNSVRTTYFSTNASFSYNFSNNLKFSLNGSFSNLHNTNDFYMPIKSQDPATNPLGIGTFGATKGTNYSITPTFNYQGFIGKGSLDMLLAGEYQYSALKATSIYGLGYIDDELIESPNYAQMTQVSETNSESKFASIYTRLNYNYAGKYVFTVNFRRDGSSKFAPGAQYGNFGSVAGAWIISEEQIGKNIIPTWITFLKLRGSIGYTGNDGIGNYQYLSTFSNKYSTGQSRPNYSYGGIQAYVPTGPFNQVYRWESSLSRELALDLAFLKDRLNLSVSYYERVAGNQLTRIPTPNYTGFNHIVMNWDAKVRNSGVESMLDWNIVNKSSLSVKFNVNIARNLNKLLSYPGIENSPYARRYVVGESLNVRHFLQYLGIDPLTGEIAFYDANKDGAIRYSNTNIPGKDGDDRIVRQNTNSKFDGGFGLDVKWKQIHVAVRMAYSKQLGAYPGFAINPGGMSNIMYFPAIERQRWEKPGDDAIFSKIATYSSGVSALPYVDASYIKINNFSLSYSLPALHAKRIGVQAMSFSMNAQNLYTLTPYFGDATLRIVGQGSFQSQPLIMVGVLSVTF